MSRLFQYAVAFEKRLARALAGQQRARDRDPLALAARELVGIASRVLRQEPHHLEQPGRPLAPLGRRAHPVDVEGLGHEVPDLATRVQRRVRVLVDDLGLAPELFQSRPVERCEIRAVEAHAARRGRLQAQQDWIRPPERYVFEYADILRLSSATRDQAEALLHSLLRRQPSSSGAWHVLADLLGRQQLDKVLLIADPSSSVNALVQSTRATGVVQGEPGNLPNNNLVIKYVPQGEAIKIGDTIITSGLGGNFPKRLVIGQVTEVRKRDSGLFQEATIQPTVDFARLEFVLIMKRFTPADMTSEPTRSPTPLPKPSATPTAKR